MGLPFARCQRSGLVPKSTQSGLSVALLPVRTISRRVSLGRVRRSASPRGQSSRAAQREAADSKGRKRPLGEAPGDSPEGAEHPTPSSQGSLTSPPPTSTPGALKVSLESLQDSNLELARMRAAIEAQAKVDELKMILEYEDDEASKAEVKKKLLKLLKERQGL